MSLAQLGEHQIVKTFVTEVIEKEGRVDFSRWNWPSKAEVRKEISVDVAIKVYEAPVERIVVIMGPYGRQFPAPFKVYIPGYGWKTVDTTAPTILYQTGRQNPGFEKQIISKIYFERGGTYRGQIRVGWLTLLGEMEYLKVAEFEISGGGSEGENMFQKVVKYLKDYWYIPTAISVGVITYCIAKKVKKR